MDTSRQSIIDHLEELRFRLLWSLLAVLVMLVPVDDSLEVNTGIMGYISSMLIEEPDFLDTAAGGDEEIIRQELSGHLNRYFKEYLGNLA